MKHCFKSANVEDIHYYTKESWVYHSQPVHFLSVCALSCRNMVYAICRNNPQAFSNLLKRLIEASGRGMWRADEATLEQLKGMYSDLDAQLEGIK